MPTTTRSLTASIPYSGTTLALEMLSNGQPANVTQITFDSSQLLTVHAGGGTLQLTFNGQTTVALPVGILG